MNKPTVVLILGAAVLLGFVINSELLNERPTPASPTPAASSSLRATAMTDLQGRSQSFNQLAGQRTLVYLWATWCAPCLKTLSQVAAIQQQSEATTPFIALALDKDLGKIAAIIDKANYTGTTWIALDGIRPLQRGDFGHQVSALPYLFELDEQLNIVRGSYQINTSAQWQALLTRQARLGELATLLPSL